MTDTAATESTAEGAVAPDAGAIEGADASIATGAETVREADDWRGSITDPKLKNFSDRFATPADAAKAAFDLRQKLSNAITIPGENASDEDRAAFRKAVGVPDTPEGYEVRVPDTLPENIRAMQETPQAKGRVSEFLKAMHEAGAPKAAAEKAVAMFYQYLGEDAESMGKASEKTLDTADQAIRKEWGRDYDANLNAANTAFREFAPGTDFKDELGRFVYMGPDESRRGLPANADPAMLQMFATVGRRMSEDGFMATTSEDQRQTLAQQHKDLTEQIHAAHARGDRVAVSPLENQRAEISAKLDGSGPLVGAGGRTT